MIIDLSTVRLFDNSQDNPYGQYTQGIITRNYGTPDGLLPILVDPTVTYLVRYKYDPTNTTWDEGGRGFWLTALRPGSIDADYLTPGLFGNIYNNESPNAALDDVTITIGPGINSWDTQVVGAGATALYFESARLGALSYIEITPDPLIPATSWPGTVPLVSGLNNAAMPAAPGSRRPYYPVFWGYTPETSQDLTLDTFQSLAGDLSAADTQIWVLTGPTPEFAVTQAFNDDAPSPPAPERWTSQVTFHFLAGVEYYIRVGTYDNTGDTVTQYGLTAPFTGANTYGQTGPPTHPPDPPDPEAAFYQTEIASTLAPDLGKLPIGWVWSQTSPALPVLTLHPDHGTVRFENPALTADTDFVLSLTVTDNLGGTYHEDHTVHVKAHNYWTITGGVLHGIQQTHSLSPKYAQSRSTRSSLDLATPYTTVQVSDENGWLATFTIGCRSVLMRRTDDAPALSLNGATLTPPGRLLLLSQPFGGVVDDVVLDEMLDASRMDLYDICYAMANRNITTINGVQVYGPNTYDPTADFNDYLGVTFAGEAPDLALTGKISPAGFVRLVFGEAGLGMSTAIIPALSLDQAQAGPGMQVIDPENYMPSRHLLSFLQMGDVLGFIDPALNRRTGRETHVGIYLGRDSTGVARFMSCRQEVDGVSAADHLTPTPEVLSQVLPYQAPYPPKYSGWLVSARRY